MTYRAPVADIAFTLNHIAGLPQLIERGLFEDLDMDTAMAILEEAARFANEEIAPTNRASDEQGARLVDGAVVMPDGVAEAYRKWVEGGWGSVAVPREFGGQGLPYALSLALTEIWNGANMAYGLCPMLTQAGVNAIIAHGSPELQRTYLPKLVTGEWTGSMQLTEPQAGSDLRFMKTRAIPAGDGSYKITGSKIFITYGEHPMTENIVHMVLARLPDAPAGTKGLSLFLIPKRLVNGDGSLGALNDVACAKLEHKLGINGSPTAVLNYGDKGGAMGWLVGEPNGGLKAMFTMMIEARIGVGAQGAGIAERGFQQALGYARDRKQGAAEGGDPNGSVAIVEHPDVKRMLLIDEGENERRARDLLCDGGCDGHRASRAGRGRAPPRLCRGRAAHARRQGIRDRHRRRGRLRRHPGAWRHGLHRGDGRRAALPRRAHRADLRGHERHPGHRPRHAQARVERRRDAGALHRRAEGDGARAPDSERARPSAQPPGAWRRASRIWRRRAAGSSASFRKTAARRLPGLRRSRVCSALPPAASSSQKARFRPRGALTAIERKPILSRRGTSPKA